MAITSLLSLLLVCAQKFLRQPFYEMYSYTPITHRTIFSKAVRPVILRACGTETTTSVAAISDSSDHWCFAQLVIMYK